MATAKQEAGAEKAAKKQTKAGTGIHAPVKPSDDLGKVVGSDAMPRSEVISKVWEYIRNNNLQNPENKREILADDNLKKVFGKDKATMFEMNKFISAHLSKA
jgi:upstream activation factor subunit UAF30